MKNGARVFSSGVASDVAFHPSAHASASELAEHARTIEHLIRKLDRRGAHITPTEEARAQVLKRLRLVVKDRLASIKSN
jgi:hypothetical protein